MWIFNCVIIYKIRSFKRGTEVMIDIEYVCIEVWIYTHCDPEIDIYIYISSN